MDDIDVGSRLPHGPIRHADRQTIALRDGYTRPSTFTVTTDAGDVVWRPNRFAGRRFYRPGAHRSRHGRCRNSTANGRRFSIAARSTSGLYVS